jgi:hypothetical protein
MSDIFAEFNKVDAASETEAAVRRAYKGMFSGAEGSLVFEDMLWNLKFLSPCETEGDMALNNYAKSLVALVYGDAGGVVESGKLKNLIKRVFRRKNV